MRTIAAIFSGVLLGIAPAQEDADLPSPVTPDRFQHLLDKPPFRRVLSLSESLVLSGVAKLPNGHMVTVLNKDTRETFTVSKRPNAQGWRLISVTAGENLRNVEAKISTGAQELALRFDPNQLQPEIIRKQRRRLKPGAKAQGTAAQEEMKKLPGDVLKGFDTLPPEGQESFRKAFLAYTRAYPEASVRERADFSRRRMDTVREEVDQAQAADGEPPAEASASAAPAPQPTPAGDAPVDPPQE